MTKKYGNRAAQKRLPRLCALALAALLLTACGAKQTPASGEAESDGLLICASFYTMADFAGRIAGDRAEVVNLIPAGGEPHDWEPTAQDIALLETADLLVINGVGFEHWVEGVVPSLGNQALRVVDTSESVELLEGDRDGDAIHEADPHLWLDPIAALAQMQAVRDALIALDPDGADDYNQNFEEARRACEELDAEYQAAIEALPGREIVVAHEAFGYLCNRYGLRQISAQGLSPESEPDPARMAEVTRQAGENGIRIVFFEEMASPKIAEAIAREIGAETAVLSPIEGLTEAQSAAGGDYFSVMRENLEQLKAALA